MPFVNVLPELLVRDHGAAVSWFERFFDRPPDRRPMDGLAEWQLTGSGGLQVSQHEDAAPSRVTLAVSGIDGFVADLRERGIDTEASDVPSGRFRIAAIIDPDGNTLTLAEDLGASPDDATGKSGHRKLVVTQNITLDGVIDASEGWFGTDGVEDFDESDMIAELRKQQEEADAVLMGRVTFEEMRGYWPLQTNDPTGVTDYFNNVSKYVVSNALTDPQ